MSDEPLETYSITQAFSSHLELATGLFDQYRMFYGQSSDMSLARDFLRARIQHQDAFIFLAIEEDRPPSGPLGFVLLYPSYDSVAAAPIWILNDIFVANEARRRRVGDALMKRAEELARETGAKRLLLTTAVDNVVSHRFYEALGYKRDAANCRYILDL